MNASAEAILLSYAIIWLLCLGVFVSAILSARNE
jgi:hypothetical protein